MDLGVVAERIKTTSRKNQMVVDSGIDFLVVMGLEGNYLILESLTKNSKKMIKAYQIKIK